MKKNAYILISLGFLIAVCTGVFYMGYLRPHENTFDDTKATPIISHNFVEISSLPEKGMNKGDATGTDNQPSDVLNSVNGQGTSGTANNATTGTTNNPNGITTNNTASTATSTPSVNENKATETQKSNLDKHGLVELIKLDDSFVIDIKYATEDNFIGKKIYTMPVCLIHKDVAKKLINANNEFKALGYRIKIFDAYRPYSAQQVLWDAADDKSYVANPKKGSIHNRGAAVDITLVDMDGNELPMPSGYDEFSERAHLKYDKCEQELIDNRELLGKIMVKNGFRRISTEWWHFDDVSYEKYPILDLSFEEYLQEN